MGRIFKQSVFTSAFSYFGVLIGVFNLLWLYPYAMDEYQIGLFRIIQDTALLLMPFAQAGFAQSIVRFFPQFYDHQEKKKQFLGFILVAIVISYLVFTILFVLFKPLIIDFFEDNANAVNEHLIKILVLVLILVANSFMENYYRSILRIIMPNFAKDVIIRVLSSLLILLYVIQWISFYEVIIGILVIYALAATANLVYLVRISPVHFSLRFDTLDRKMIKQIIVYSFFALIGAGGSFLVFKVDSVMVTGMLGLGQNGIYTTVFFMAVIIEMPRRAVAQIMAPLLSKHIELDDFQEVARLYKMSALYLFLFSAVFYLLIVWNLDQIFQLMPKGEKFATGKWVVVIIGAGKLTDMLFGVNGEIIVMSKHYKFNVVSLVILAALTILTNLLLIPEYGINGAAMASAFSYLAFNLVKFAFVWWKFRIQPFQAKILIIFLVMLVASLSIAWFDPGWRAIWVIITRSLILMSVIILLLKLLNVVPEVEKRVLEYFRQHFLHK